jgi:hypothetical protein
MGRRVWAQWTREERDRARGRRRALRARMKILTILDEEAATVHASDLRPRLARVKKASYFD